MSDRDLVSALKENKLHIDCYRMVLIQNKADNPRTFIGSGYIDQDDEGVICFKLYVASTKNTSTPQGTIDLFFGGGKPGTLYAEEEYFQCARRSWRVPAGASPARVGW